MEDRILILGVIVIVLSEIIGWTICHFMCEHKYYWCKGECEKCYNWKCKYFRNKARQGLAEKETK